MRPQAVDAAAEIDRTVQGLLRGSKAWGKFPTPIDRVTAFAELAIERKIDLGKVAPGFIPRNFEFLSRGLKKVQGLIDFLPRKIYLDHSLKENRKRFVTLHEVGHGTLPWQRALPGGYGDDEFTLSPDVKEQFECEASYFASAALFQLHRFDDELIRLPLGFASVRALAQKFGGSVQAAARRYVVSCPKRCALLVLNPPNLFGTYAASTRNCFESPTFLSAFGPLLVPADFGIEFDFVRDIKRNRKLHESGMTELETTGAGRVAFDYHFFHNTFHSFVFLFPPGEKIASRVKIQIRNES